MKIKVPDGCKSFALFGSEHPVDPDGTVTVDAHVGAILLKEEGFTLAPAASTQDETEARQAEHQFE